MTERRQSPAHRGQPGAATSALSARRSVEVARLEIAGYLGRDAQIITTPEREFVALSVGTSRRWRDGGGQLQHDTLWVKVLAFGEAAAALRDLEKGAPVYAVGPLSYDRWEDASGPRHAPVLRVSEREGQAVSALMPGGQYARVLLAGRITRDAAIQHATPDGGTPAAARFGVHARTAHLVVVQGALVEHVAEHLKASPVAIRTRPIARSKSRPSATDADGDRLTYAWSGCASDALPTSKCAVPRLTLGTFPATVTIHDGWTSVTRTVSARGWNTPPNLSASASAAGCHPRPGAPCVVPLTSTPSDLDGDPVTVNWSGCADGTGVTAACEVHALGTHTATATASDPFGATRAVTVGVQGQNRAPVVSAAPTAGSGFAFPFTWSWSDGDGDQLQCSFGIVQSAVCTFGGNCNSAGGSSSGSIGCQAKVEIGQDPSTRCDYRLVCNDGWTSAEGTFRLN